jgi:hypothetical protein
MLRIPYNPAVYISEKLNQRLLEEQITGIETRESKIEFLL